MYQTEDKKSHIGFVADDIEDGKMPKVWDNMNGCCALELCARYAKKITSLKTEVTKFKNNNGKGEGK